MDQEENPQINNPHTPTPHGAPLQQQDHIAFLMEQIASLTAQVQALQSTAPAPSTPAPSSPTPGPILKVNPPDVFDGSISKTDSFLKQCQLFFIGRRIQNDVDKIVLALSFMKGGTAAAWADRFMTLMESGDADEYGTWDTFKAHLLQSFGDPDPAGSARFKLSQLKQGSLSAEEYVSKFNELKDRTLYNDAALKEMFQEGLNSKLVDKIYDLPEMPTNLKEWQTWATKFDRQWRQRNSQKKQAGFSTLFKTKPAASTSTPEPKNSPSPAKAEYQGTPMDIDSGRRSMGPRVCWKCRKPGHFAQDCKSTFNVNSLDFDGLKEYMKKELQEEGF